MITIRQISALACAAVVAGTLQGCSATGGYRASAGSPEDAKLAADVRAALDSDRAIRRSDVEIAAVNSRVVLTGTVDTSLERKDAGEIAAQVPGVTAVDNALTLRNNGG